MGNSISLACQRVVFLVTLYLFTAVIFLIAFTQHHTPQSGWENMRLVMLALFAPIALKYLIQLTTAPFYYWIEKKRQHSKIAQPLPTVTVLIPAWNEEVGIIKTVTSVIATQYPALEVIVINDGSTDKTDQLMREYLDAFDSNNSHNICIRYFALENGGKANALNYALTEATGDIIITIDADSLMHPQSIHKMMPFFTDPTVAAVAGNVAIGNRLRPLGLIQQLEYLYGFFFKRADSVFNAVYIIGGAAAAYRKDLLVEAGGFDHSIITEDIEISTRLLRMGYKTRYAADAITYTEGPSDCRGLCNQRLRWKFGRFQTFWKHRALFFSRAPQHNRYLSWFLLPLAVYAEILLLLEIPLLALFFGYMISTSDYLPLIVAILFFTTIISLQLLTDKQLRFHANLLPLVPVAWIVCYLIDAVEFQAITRSLSRFSKGEGLQWQRWIRSGVSSPERDKDQLNSTL